MRPRREATDAATTCYIIRFLLKACDKQKKPFLSALKPNLPKQDKTKNKKYYNTLENQTSLTTR
jgi:hypothetical protein